MKCTVPDCGAPALKDDPDGRCFWHSEDREVIERRREASSRGGCNSKKVMNPQTSEDLNLALLKDVDELVSRTLRATITGDLSVTVAKATGYLARSLTMIRETALLEARIAALEERIDKMGGM